MENKIHARTKWRDASLHEVRRRIDVVGVDRVGGILAVVVVQQIVSARRVLKLCEG